jgi:glycosyltransferase involved in cell wall biosynthesis
LRGDAVYATSTPLTIAIPAIGGTLLAHTPFVFEVRDLWPDVPIAMGYLRNPVARRSALVLERAAYSRAAHIVTISPGIREDIIAKGVSASKVTVVPHGCDPELFQGVTADRLRKEHAWLDRGPVVLYAGALGVANGVSYLLDVAREMLPMDPNVGFAVIGDGKEGSELRAKSANDGTLDVNVHFLGRRPKDEVAEWLQASAMSLALLQGPRIMWKDAGQNKFFDAIASGTPVACNNDSWQSELAVGKGVGIHIDPSDPHCAAVQLHSALTDMPWQASVQERCQEMWSGEFNRGRLAAVALHILEGIQ